MNTIIHRLSKNICTLIVSFGGLIGSSINSAIIDKVSGKNILIISDIIRSITVLFLLWSNLPINALIIIGLEVVATGFANFISILESLL